MASGYNLRNLIEDEGLGLSSVLNNFQGNTHNNNYYKHQISQVPPSNNNNQAFAKEHYTSVNDKGGLQSQPCNRANASLQQQAGPWYDNGQDDFDLQFMGLEEFLNETGLPGTIFENEAPNASPTSNSSSLRISPHALGSSPQAPPCIQPPCTPLSSLEQLLLRGNSSLNSSPVSYTQSTCSDDGKQALLQQRSPTTSSQHSPQAMSHQYSPASQRSPATSESSCASETGEETPKARASDAPLAVVKKRKYSEDGEGLTDTTVVVVPGQEGFNPAEAKFAPEDLQPQPIIKKSRKQFVSEDNKDEKYWKRRNKNNVAAKRSREARRAKENQIIMRASFLESENGRLTKENSHLLSENEQLKELVKQLQKGQASGGGSN